MAYATTAQLDSLSSASQIVSTLEEAAKTEALDVASSLADGYLRQRYALPLSAFCPDLTRAVCAIAAYDLLSVRGYDPVAEDNGNIRVRYEDAIKWLERVASSEISPDIEDSAPTGEDSSAPGLAIRSLPPRWF